MVTRNRTIERACIGKRQFETMAIAAIEAAKVRLRAKRRRLPWNLPDYKQVPYRCPFGDHFHIGRNRAAWLRIEEIVDRFLKVGCDLERMTGGHVEFAGGPELLHEQARHRLKRSV